MIAITAPTVKPVTITMHATAAKMVFVTEDRRLSTAEIEVRLESITDGVQENLDSKKFMFIPAEQAAYMENPAIFGDDFVVEFPEGAIFEAAEAGNCYAAGRWTACVFHCMRVAEYGLRKLAKTLKVTLSHKGKKYPIEFGDWDAVITAIRNKIIESRQLPRGPKKAELLRAYSQAGDHCEYMKDIWRNEISHTRRRYDKNESLGVINRVRGFLESVPKRPKPKTSSADVP